MSIWGPVTSDGLALGIGGQVGIQRGLEIAGQIAPGDSPQDLAVLYAQARVARPATTAAFLEQFLTDTHPTITAQPCDVVIARACFSGRGGRRSG